MSGCSSIAIVELDSLAGVSSATGPSLEECGIEILPELAHQAGVVWIADASLQHAYAIRANRRVAVAVLPLAAENGRAERRLVLVRDSAGVWLDRDRVMVEAFLPLIERLTATRSDDAGQALVDNISDFAWIKDGESRFVAVNQALARAVGRTREEMLGKTDHAYFPIEIADEYVRGDREVFRRGTPYKSVDPIPDGAGGMRWIETIKSPVRDRSGTIVGTAGVARDITSRQDLEAERTRLVDELAREHDRLTDTIANVPGVVWEEVFDNSYRFVSDQVEGLLGYTATEYLHEVSGFLEIVHPEDRSVVEERTSRMIADRNGGVHSFRMLRKDGSAFWCESHCRVMFNGSGEPVGLRGVSFDITERKAAEDRLRASEEHFRTLADATPIMIWTTNSAGEMEFHNRRMRDFLGLENRPVRGNEWIQGIHPDDLERVTAVCEEALHLQHWISFEMRYRRHDGEYRDLLLDGAPREAPDGSFGGFVGSCVDLTDRRVLERRLAQDRQLSSLGRLASTIAHEINNVLMAIQPFADAIRHAPSQKILTRAADQITSAVQRGGRITHQILRFTRTSEPQSEPIDVQSWVASSAAELKAVLGPAIQLRVDIDTPVCVLADPHQLMQVFTNLAANARDAISGPGTLTIAAYGESAWPGLPSEDGPFVHLVVRDDGPGIAPDVLDRLFEPLFTTKIFGKGLGLAIVRDIVRRHRGDIYAESEEGSGTAFHMILRAGACIPGVQDAEPPDSLPSTVGRILLVEDDDMVSAGVSGLLELEGAEVSVVTRGGEAVAAIARFKPDLVVLDVGLPDMPGTEVFEQLRQASPDLPVIFSTGHAGEIVDEIDQMPGPVALLLKPYDFATLIGTIRRLRS